VEACELSQRQKYLLHQKMGEARLAGAEKLAEMFNITREDLNKWAWQSNMRLLQPRERAGSSTRLYRWKARCPTART
jgi:hypothetical protein